MELVALLDSKGGSSTYVAELEFVDWGRSVGQASFQVPASAHPATGSVVLTVTVVLIDMLSVTLYDKW